MRTSQKFLEIEGVRHPVRELSDALPNANAARPDSNPCLVTVTFSLGLSLAYATPIPRNPS